jgi:glucose/arabinose dehydrogenase
LTADVFQGGYTERGLLGIAFHPDFENNGIFFVHYIRYDNKAIVEQYTVSSDDPNIADPASAAVILSLDDPFPNHNGGQLAFGPDGYLYIGIGDGGDLGDPLGNGQNTKTLFGKILRVDVNNTDTYTVPETNPFVGNDDYAPEIWALGFRNPWRFSFDRATGDLYIGDVGEATWEEINFQPADSPGGQNYGWNAYEGNHPFDEDTPVPDEMTLPIAEYSHNEGCSVTAGYAYRGEMMPELQGIFFFGDYCTGGVWITQPLAEGIWLTTNYGYLGHQISSFGEDESGELYLADYKGGIYQLQPIE